MKPKAMLFGAHYLAKKKSKETTGMSTQAPLTRAGDGKEHGGIGVKYQVGTDPDLSPKHECEAGCDHGPKWKSCVKKVTAKGSDVDPYAVCTTSVGQKNSKRESAKVKFVGHLKETNGITQTGDGRRFRTTLLQEGLGNLGDCYYYTAEAIRSAPAIFEGKKYFIDHPTTTEEADHPERSVRDVAGYFENVQAEVDQDGRTNLNGDVVVMPGTSFDQVRALMLESIEFAKKHAGQHLVGLSINAGGDFETVTLDEFLKTESIPDPCKPKLMEAMAQGITQIKPVREMKSAFSCDLVTEPGAGGSINSLLEGARKMAKQKKEEEAVDPKMKQEEAAAADGDGGAGGGDHPDADQDKALIAQQLKKHLGLGDDDEPSEEEAALMHQAYESSKEMGMEHDEAMKCAEHNLKMAKHMQAKQKEADADSSGGKDAGAPAFGAKPKAVGGAGSVPGKDQKMESNRSHRDVKLAAEVAALRSKLDAMELEKHVEKSLRESKLPMAATKKLRECLKGVRTQKEVTEKLNVFKEAFRLGGETEGTGFILGAERTTTTFGTEGMDFSDCVDKD